MANSIIGPVLYIDTAGIVTTSETPVSTLVWSGCTTNAHALVIKDKNSNVIFSLLGSANGTIVLNLPRTKIFQGLNVVTIASGIVTIY